MFCWFDEFMGDGVINDFVVEDEFFVFCGWMYDDFCVIELVLIIGLMYEVVFVFSFVSDCFFVGYLWMINVCLDVEFLY